MATDTFATQEVGGDLSMSPQTISLKQPDSLLSKLRGNASELVVGEAGLLSVQLLRNGLKSAKRRHLARTILKVMSKAR